MRHESFGGWTSQADGDSTRRNTCIGIVHVDKEGSRGSAAQLP